MRLGGPHPIVAIDVIKTESFPLMLPWVLVEFPKEESSSYTAPNHQERQLFVFLSSLKCRNMTE